MTEIEKLNIILEIDTLSDQTISKAKPRYKALEGYTIQSATPDYVYNIGQPSQLVGFTLKLKKDGRDVMQTFRFPKDKK